MNSKYMVKTRKKRSKSGIVASSHPTPGVVSRDSSINATKSPIKINNNKPNPKSQSKPLVKKPPVIPGVKKPPVIPGVKKPSVKPGVKPRVKPQIPEETEPVPKSEPSISKLRINLLGTNRSKGARSNTKSANKPENIKTIEGNWKENGKGKGKVSSDKDTHQARANLRAKPQPNTQPQTRPTRPSGTSGPSQGAGSSGPSQGVDPSGPSRGPPPRPQRPPRSQVHLGTSHTNIRQAVEQTASRDPNSSLFQGGGASSHNPFDELRPRKRTLTPQQEALFQGNSLRPKKKVLGTTNPTVPAQAQTQAQTPAQAPTQAQVKTVDEMIRGNGDLVQDCINVIIQCDPDQKCSKDELIARIEYQKNLLLKRNEGVRDKRIIAMEKILHDLRDEQIREGLATMEVTRDAQNKIVLSNPMEEDIYKQKIDLTLPENKRKKGDDPNCILFKNSRNWWRMEGKKKYQTPVKLEAEFKKTRGNKKLPKELARKLPGY